MSLPFDSFRHPPRHANRRAPRSCAAITAVALGLVIATSSAAHARNLMSADGPGGTYELLRQAYTTELPDCGHMVPHITEEFDDELKKNVFVFHAHVNQDDDRCGGTDRQRTEIRARAADIVAENGETLYYRWKFKLATGFKGSPSFTHIFQIKSDLGAPIMTLTPRVNTFEITGRAGGPGRTDLAKFIGVWVAVDLKVLYSDNGRIEITIKRVSDGMTLFSHAGGADMWDAGASGHDSKFGIYRSLNNRGMLRDEQVRFADFCASKTSAAECADGAAPPPSDAGAGDGGAADASGAETGAGGAGGGGAGGSGGSGGMGEGGSGGGSGGSPGTGGATASGGAGGNNGTGGSKPPGNDAGSRDTRPPSAPSEPGGESPSGCGCDIGSAPATRHHGAWLIIAALAWQIRRRRRSP